MERRRRKKEIQKGMERKVVCLLLYALLLYKYRVIQSLCKWQSRKYTASLERYRTQLSINTARKFRIKISSKAILRFLQRNGK